MIVTPEIHTKIKAVAERHGISLLVLFGSQATGKTHPQSDVDIGFVSETRLGPREVADLAYTLSQELKTSGVDLANLRDAPPLLLKNIVGGSRLLYEKEPQLFARFKIYALKLFMEAQSLLAAREASLKAFLQQV